MNLYWVKIGLIVGLKNIPNQRVVLVRLTTVLLFVLLSGFSLYDLIHPAALPHIVMPVWNFFVIVYLYQLISLATTWVSGYRNNDHLVRLVNIFPIAYWQKRFLNLLPSLTYLILVVVGSLPIMIPIRQVFGLSIYDTVSAVSVGSVSGLGLYQIRHVLKGKIMRLLYWPTTVITLYIEHQLLQTLTWPHFRYRSISIVIITALIASSLLVVFTRLPIRTNNTTPLINDRLRLRHLPRSLWPLIVVLRSRSTSLSFMSTGLLSITMAIFIYEKHGPETLIGSCIALFIAGASTDLRYLSTLYNPVAITGMRGSITYVARQTWTALMCASLVCVPITLLTPHMLVNCGLATLCKVVVGVSIGLCFSHTFARSERTIIPPLFVTVFGTYFLCVLPEQVWFQSHPLFLQTILYFLESLFFLCLALIAEYHRNPYRWRLK